LDNSVGRVKEHCDDLLQLALEDAQPHCAAVLLAKMITGDPQHGDRGLAAEVKDLQTALKALPL